jgi:hypothetical protein
MKQHASVVLITLLACGNLVSACNKDKQETIAIEEKGNTNTRDTTAIEENGDTNTQDTTAIEENGDTDEPGGNGFPDTEGIVYL